ncbi:unnamed protein product [Mytilus coruscus]|uniref:EB domain-containing protein n=1 Tax=Mytilus coruscus TaxID=42192 RepID=A0A6J8CB20_MYTCO|nr:unnamed protein product [Mytilus coruscus]
MYSSVPAKKEAKNLLARFVGIWMVFVIFIAVGVEGAPYDGNCTTESCTEENNACSNDTCICNPESFRRASPPSCVKKIELNAVCMEGDECADTLAICDLHKLKCLCTQRYFEKNDGTCAARINYLEHTCDATQSASDQCIPTNSECRMDGTARCLCKTTYYAFRRVCRIRKSPNASCRTNQCVIHAKCTNDSCKCDADYEATPIISPTMCSYSSGVKFAALPYMYVVPFLVSMLFFFAECLLMLK